MTIKDEKDQGRRSMKNVDEEGQGWVKVTRRLCDEISDLTFEMDSKCFDFYFSIISAGVIRNQILKIHFIFLLNFHDRFLTTLDKI